MVDDTLPLTPLPMQSLANTRMLANTMATPSIGMPGLNMIGNTMAAPPIGMPALNMIGGQGGGGGQGSGQPSEDWIVERLLEREQARSSKDFQRGDQIRDELSRRGVTVNDQTRSWTAEDGRSGVRPNAIR